MTNKQTFEPKPNSQGKTVSPDKSVPQSFFFERHWIKCGRPVKRSVNIAGHRTSFSLEEPFWVGLREIAGEQGMTLSGLICMLDELRYVKTADIGLSGAIRIFVFKHYLDRLSQSCGSKTSIHALFEEVQDDQKETATESSLSVCEQG